jgi:hypothetical protein
MDGLEYAFDHTHVQWTANIISHIKMAKMIIPTFKISSNTATFIMSEMSTVMFGILDFASLQKRNKE